MAELKANGVAILGTTGFLDGTGSIIQELMGACAPMKRSLMMEKNYQMRGATLGCFHRKGFLVHSIRRLRHRDNTAV
ncbi:hypothetical protein AB1K83_07770 [Sporosarcina sp. 179-K 3D1 HS]|uniref:hypothetical protein n=1 Tax=Sporosarcina sp. 179-K 3D1 HS TaxID=3232169 RepID=UPI0039A0FFFE